MGFTGMYVCPVNPADPDFEVKVVAGAGSPKARIAMLAHGSEVHGADWSGVGNQEFVATPAADLTTAELKAKIEELEAWQKNNQLTEEQIAAITSAGM